MVSLFSKLSARGSRRTQNALNRREVSSSDAEASGAAATAAASHGIEVPIEFKPIEHPIEPLEYDTPIQCSLPEPSILNDGSIWKKQVSANARRRADLPIVKDGEGETIEPESVPAKPTTVEPKRIIVSSMSVPEHSLQKLLNTSSL